MILIMEERPSLSGKLVTFLIGQSAMNLEATHVVESRTRKSSPAYPDVVPKQKIIRDQKEVLGGREIHYHVKAYLPDTLIVEATVLLEDLLSESIFTLKRDLIHSCRRILQEHRCDPEFDEEYNVYCISGYTGDPEVYLALHGDRIAAHLKNERIELDDEEIRITLQAGIKYGKDDLTLIDWDGAFIFDPEGDFDSNIELFEIANDQLLRLRVLDARLDQRLSQTAQLLGGQEKWLFRSKEIRSALKEIIQIRTQSIMESASLEQNIKLIGDWYSARLYSLIAKKFHVDEWERTISEKLDVLEDVYTMASDKFSVSFSTTLEFILIAGWFILLIGWFGIFLLDLSLIE